MTWIRRATDGDAPLLRRMLGLAVAWRPDSVAPTEAELMASPHVARYIVDWPAHGDVGFVAEGGELLGAAWWRFFTQAEHGDGFVDETTPEISIVVLPAARGRVSAPSCFEHSSRRHHAKGWAP